MPSLPTIVPLKARRHRKRRSSLTPVLTYANFNDDGLFLIFSCAIDIAQLTPMTIVITTPELRYECNAGELETSDRVRLHMVEAGPNVGTQTLLNVGAGNGIVAVGGGEWGGVVDWELI